MSIFDIDKQITIEYLQENGFKWDDDPVIEMCDGKHSRLVRRFYPYYILKNGGRIQANKFSIINVFYQWKKTEDPDSPQYHFYIAYESPNSHRIWKSETYYDVTDQLQFEVCMNRVKELYKNITGYNYE